MASAARPLGDRRTVAARKRRNAVPARSLRARPLAGGVAALPPGREDRRSAHPSHAAAVSRAAARPENLVPKFEAAVKSAFRLGDSVAADLLIIALIYFTDSLVVGARTSQATWQRGMPARRNGISSDARRHSLRVFQPADLSVRLAPLVLPALYLGSLLDAGREAEAQFAPDAPDRVGGLGFLVMSMQAFMVFAMAHGALLAGRLSTRVVITKAKLPDFKGEIVAVVLFVLCLTLAAVTASTRSLDRAKRGGIMEYGALAARYETSFTTSRPSRRGL